jgi:conjugal transfer pilus assembly protein TraF
VSESHRGPGADERFWEKSKEGWFWYHDPPPNEEGAGEKSPERPPEAGPAAKQPERRVPRLSDYTLEQLWNLHPDDFQALLMDFMKKGVQNPSPESVTEYLVMQDIARRKSAAFANSVAFAVQMNPVFLEMNKAAPSSPIGLRQQTNLRNSALRDRLAEARNDYALLYFMSPSCTYCREFEPVLQYLVDQTGWTVREVDLAAQPELGARFGVQTTPTIFLIARDNPNYFPIAVGITTYDDLTYKMYRAVRYLEGEAGPEDFSVYPFEEGGPLDPRSIFRKNPVDAMQQINGNSIPRQRQ